MGRYGNLVKGNDKPEKEVDPIATDADIKIPSKESPKISHVISSKISSPDDAYADVVRKAVRWPGKESSPLRVTTDELTKLKSAVRHFEDQGYPTDRTQIIRIGLNYLLENFEREGDSSILTEIMERINTY